MRPAHSAATWETPEVSIVIPCLDEADTVATCVRKALRGLQACEAVGEVIVADNGSRDGSQQLATEAGAIVVPVARRGYGAALQRGIAAARGEFVIMGDADDSYDFTQIPRFVSRLRDGAALVQGCRLPSGGGQILPGAMPWSHRYFGNPLLSLIARKLLACGFHDIYCGMRGFRRDLYERLGLRCEGMEFAIEMLLAAGESGVRLDEVPITLHPDGRIAHGPHLRTVRDGIRSLRFLTRTWIDRRRATRGVRAPITVQPRTQEAFATTLPE
jgi:glycosyltransferase involved in cell wall biosynthesis